MHTFERNVRYYETDQMGVVHHSNYIRFLEEARMDLLDAAGLDYAAMEEGGFCIPVLAVSCRYKRPLRFPERFRIVLRLRDFNGVRFFVDYQIYKEGETKLAATAESEHCFADRNLKPLRIEKHYPPIRGKLLGDW